MLINLLAFNVFLLFLQPVSIFPELAPLNPIRNVTILSLIFFLLSQKEKCFSFAENTNKCLVVFIVFELVSPMTEWLGSLRFGLVSWLLYLIMYYLIIKSCDDSKKIMKIAASIVLSIGYVSLYSVSKFVLNYESGIRAKGFGWYDNSNDLSLILVCSVPLAFLVAELATKTSFKLFYISVSCLMVLNVLYSGSRNGLLGLTLVVSMSLLYSNMLSRPLKVVGGSLLLAGLLFVGSDVVLNRADLQGFSGDESSENRIVQWQAGLRMIVANPLLGVGPNQYKDRAGDYGGISNLEPHNTLIQVFAEIGVIGGFYFALFAFTPMRCAFRYIKSFAGKERQPAAVCYRYLFTSLAGFWTCAFFSNRYKSYILYILVALIISVKTHLVRSSEEMEEAVEPIIDRSFASE